MLSRLFRRLFLEHLHAAFAALSFFDKLAALTDRTVFEARLAGLRAREWVVYAKPPSPVPSRCSLILAATPIASPSPTAASSRLPTGGSASADYRHHNKSKVMTIAAFEFIRRFLLHTLADGFHRIRHYGFLPTVIAQRSSPSVVIF